MQGLMIPFTCCVFKSCTEMESRHLPFVFWSRNGNVELLVIQLIEAENNEFLEDCNKFVICLQLTVYSLAGRCHTFVLLCTHILNIPHQSIIHRHSKILFYLKQSFHNLWNIIIYIWSAYDLTCMLIHWTYSMCVLISRSTPCLMLPFLPPAAGQQMASLCDSCHINR